MNNHYKALASSNYILDKLEKHKIKDITNLKLQKLLYLAYGLHLLLYDDNQLFNSSVQAWKVGVVIPDAYMAFKNHGSKPITTRAHILKEDYTGEVMLASYTGFTESDKRSLDIACATYGCSKAWSLVDIAGKEQSAWLKVYKANARHLVIPSELIKAEVETYIDDLAGCLLD